MPLTFWHKVEQESLLCVVAALTRRSACAAVAGSPPCGRKVARPPTAAQSAQARSVRSASLSCPLGRARYSRPWTSDAGAGALIFGDIQLGWRSANSRTGRRAWLWSLRCASSSEWPPPTALTKEPCARSACCCSFGKHWWLAHLWWAARSTIGDLPRCALRCAIFVAAPPPAGLLPPPWPTSRVQGAAGGAPRRRTRRRTRLLAWTRCFGMVRESRALLRPPATLGECVRALTVRNSEQ